MEKKSKKSILIGITSLFLITLILLGLTYAYYRTRIIGNNSEEQSIGVQSKKLEIRYSDGVATMNMEGNIAPGFIATKEFSVKNTGDDSLNYRVTLDNINNSFERTEDWTYELILNDETTTGIVPKNDKGIYSNSIAPNEEHKYILKVTYANLPNIDQSIDMGKSLSFRVNIDEVNYKIEFKDDSSGIVNTSLTPVTEENILNSNIKKTFTISNLNKEEETYVSLELNDITISESLNDNDLNWALYSDGTLVNNYSFKGNKDESSRQILANYKLLPNESKTFDLVIYILENETNSNQTISNPIEASILSGEDEIYTPNLFVDVLDNLTFKNGHISETDGKLYNGINSNGLNLDEYRYTDFINLNGKSLLFHTNPDYSVDTHISFYDKDKKYISGTVVNTYHNQEMIIYDVNGQQKYGYEVEYPENAEYVIFCFREEKGVSRSSLYLIDKNNMKISNIPRDYESKTTLSDVSIVNFGDSIFGNYASPVDISTYLNTYYGATTYNVAVGGTRMGPHTVDVYKPFSMINLVDAIISKDYSTQEANVTSMKEEKLNLLKSIDFNNIDYVTLAFGTNDFAGNVSIGDKDTKGSYIYSTKYVIDKMLENYPNLKIVLVTPIYRFWSDTEDSNNTQKGSNYLYEYVNALIDNFKDYSDNVYVYNSYNDLGLNKYNKYVYFNENDFTHPNFLGRRLYAYKLGKYIESINN